MPLRVGLAQINTTVGDMRANVDTIAHMIGSAKNENVDLVVFPEMCICGYPPEDLLCKPKFLNDNEAYLQSLASQTNGITTIVGLAEGIPTQCYNTAAVLENGQVKAVYRKGVLPNYGVFDEKRYFTPGQKPVIIEKKQLRIAITICEDIWNLEWLDTFFRERMAGYLFQRTTNRFDRQYICLPLQRRQRSATTSDPG
ncbi:MAG: nitrilase-related carbon-nitrogen hydrolase [Planctomycetota bacterium]|jgi:NAD+ synthase (glutamine-hydrolysing)